jgi:AraC family transcriptional regulator, arabinose operon regulatory protein
MGIQTFRFGHFTQGASYRTIRPGGSGDHLFICTLTGRGRIHFDQEHLDLAKRDLILYPPGVFQLYGTAPDPGSWELAWAHFQPRTHWVPLLQWPRWRGGIGVLRLPPGETWEGLRTALSHMVSMAHQPSASATAFALNRLEESLLWADMVAREDRFLQVDARIRRAMDYIAKNLSVPFSLDAIAQIAALSPTRFSHLFKEQTGQSPLHYSEDLRMAQAVFLLRESGLSILEIANQCGYEDSLYFSRRFRLRHELSPLNFRKAHGRTA